MMTQRSLLTLVLPLLLAPAACSSGSNGVTGPPEPPPGPAADVIHNVTVRYDSITVMGSCDHNSIFESAADGEFVFGVSVRGGTATQISTVAMSIIHGLDGTYREGVHALPSGARSTFSRNITKGERFAVVFSASEKDGILGNDPDMNNRSGQKVYDWRSTTWGGDGGVRLIELHNGSPDLCGVRLRYTILSAVAG